MSLQACTSALVRRLQDEVYTKTTSAADISFFQIDQNAEEHFNLTSEEEFGAVKSLFLGRVQGEGRDWIDRNKYTL